MTTLAEFALSGIVGEDIIGYDGEGKVLAIRE